MCFDVGHRGIEGKSRGLADRRRPGPSTEPASMIARLGLGSCHGHGSLVSHCSALGPGRLGRPAALRAAFQVPTHWSQVGRRAARHPGRRI